MLTCRTANRYDLSVGCLTNQRQMDVTEKTTVKDVQKNYLKIVSNGKFLNLKIQMI
jgi:hypothetical protein